jgi:oxygen-independent coproporphyrinogen-3 oxidase
LGALSPAAKLSLYLHIPYCTSICTYCGCHTKAVRKEAPLDAYAQTLAQEMALLADATQARQVTHIHWGGGTPSLLGPQRLKCLHEELMRFYDLSAIREHAIELDPRTVTQELADMLAVIGVTRASLGVQDLNEHVQRAIGRVQPFEVVEAAVGYLRNAGIDAINLDLMYGLPDQSVENMRQTAHLAASLAPSRLAIFGYAHVPWFKVHQKLIDQSALPGASERMAQAAAARMVLEAEGYVAIGLDHFARPDDDMALAADAHELRRNFQGYTVDVADALLPLGASSIGRLPQGYVQNAPDVAGWRRAIEAGQLPVVKGLGFKGDDILRAQVIERLMCDFAVDFGAIAKANGDEAQLDDCLPELDQLQQDGVLERQGRQIRVMPQAQPFVRLAAAAFDAYLQKNAARHSVAV